MLTWIHSPKSCIAPHNRLKEMGNMNPGPASWPLLSGACQEGVAFTQHLKEFLFFLGGTFSP